MATVTCPDCDDQISTSAAACPHCGAPQTRACPRCGERTVGDVDGLKGFEIAVALVLLAVCIVPGLAYYFDRTRLSWCSSCHRRVPR